LFRTLFDAAIELFTVCWGAEYGCVFFASAGLVSSEMRVYVLDDCGDWFRNRQCKTPSTALSVAKSMIKAQG
jgi:hypothetical protein